MVLLSKKAGGMQARLVSPTELKLLLEPTRWRILKLLTAGPNYASAVARELGLNEQLVHYHFNQLKKSGVISVVRTEEKRGALTRFFGVKDHAFAVLLREEWEEAPVPKVLKGFYTKGAFDGKIVVGSPDPHGPFQARARDGFYAADLALYLGSLSSSAKPCVRLDTEVRDDELKGNVVLVGGPIVNLITARINDSLPIRIATGERHSVYSEKTGKHYYESSGFVLRTKSPWGKGELLVVAGKSIAGTKAAILSIVQSAELLTGSNVVKGVDLDGDGVVDAAEILE
ncbi:MAG: S-layer protein [Candidatus Diapherotrites archaeon]|nr:S-layer protein [Candidatus Diapherotrites archaeon]